MPAAQQVPSSWSFVGRYWPQLVMAFLSLAVAVTTSLAIPYLLGRSVDALLSDQPGDEIPPLAMGMLALGVVQAATRIVGSVLLSWVSRHAEHDLRTRLFEHLLALDAAFYRTQRTGDIASRLTSDMSSIVQTWSMGLIWLMGAGLLLVFSTVVMITIDPILTMWALLPLPFVMLVSHHLGRMVRRRSGLAQQELGKLSSMIQEDLTGIGVVRTYQLEDQRSARFDELAMSMVRRRLALQVADSLFTPLMGAFAAASMIAVLWVGGSAVIDGEMGLGELVQFNAYLAVMTIRVVGLGDIFAGFQRGAASWKRLAELLAHQPTIVDGTAPRIDPSATRGELELRKLSFELDGRRLLDDVSLRIPAGTICALVGRIGSGKSMLVEAIPRLIDIPAGTVFLDGRDVTTLAVADVRRSIAYASQSAFLFSATIAENIGFGIDQESEDGLRDRIVSAARDAGLDPDLAVLPAGLETQVGERGITLSGGQQQRVALARAIASDRSVVILDDSLSSVDAETERKILDSLDVALRGRTVVLISHRVAAMKRAHQIAVLDRGRIVEVGGHDQLLARGGLYAEIYRAQLEEEQAG